MSKLLLLGRGLAAMMGTPPPEGQSTLKEKKNDVMWSLSQLCTSEMK